MSGSFGHLFGGRDIRLLAKGDPYIPTPYFVCEPLLQKGSRAPLLLYLDHMLFFFPS